MIPLLFLDQRWMKRNMVPTFLIVVIFIGLGIAITDWWKNKEHKV